MRFKFFIYALFLFVSANAQTPTSSLLWEISGNSLQKPSYVYGTMHYPDKRIMELGDSVLIKLKSCEVMAGELDLKEKPGREVAMSILLQGDTTLKMLLLPEDYMMVKAVAKKRLGTLEYMVIDRCKPIYVYMLLMQAEDKKAKKKDIIDVYLQNIARKEKLKVVGLETMAEQISALDAIKREDQITMLVDYVHYGDQAREETEQLINLYLSQDLQKLDSFLVHTEMPEEMAQSVMLNRNYIMVERLEKLIKAQPTFIAVGAAHLPGNEGVLELLRKKGYSVHPIVSASKSNIKKRRRK